MKIKKMLAAVLSAIMVLSLAACGESEKSGSSVTSGNITEATTTAETTAINETTTTETTTESVTTTETQAEKPQAPILTEAKAVGNKIKIEFTLPKHIEGYAVVCGTKEELNNNTCKKVDVASTSDTANVLKNLNYETSYGVALASYVEVDGEKIYSDLSDLIYVTTGKETEQTKKPPLKKSSGIDPDFKKAMDSYEEFFNEYVEFMKKYSDPNNTDVMSMLTDYSNYMQKYADTMNKLNEIDENSLNAAEAAYYTKVMARITAKLAEVAQ